MSTNKKVNKIRMFSKPTHTRVYKAILLLKGGAGFEVTCIKTNLIPDVVKKLAINLIKICPPKIAQNLIDSGAVFPKVNDYFNMIQKLKEEIS